MEAFEKENYRRNLPHRQPKTGIFNICFRLNGTLPRFKLQELKDLRDFKIAEIQTTYGHVSDTMIRDLIRKEHDLYFGKFDELLDQNSTGPKFLKEPEIAEIVADCLKYWAEKERYTLICFCIMSNHVHLMLTDIEKQLFRILQTIKTYTATKANEKLNRKGEQFWQRESYDNLVRDEEDLSIKLRYILNNPVKANLITNWKDWRFSYLNPAFEKYFYAD